jgi:small subunit ribosomal protein S6
MRRYETIYILRPTLGEEEINTVIESTNAVLTADDGDIIAIDKWGLRKLAYLIKKESNGYYVFCDYGTDPANVTEMERKFRIDDAVMKYMTLKVADTIDVNGITAARSEYEAAKVAAAELAEQEEEVESDIKETPAKTKPAVKTETKAESTTEESATEESGE